MPPEPTNPAAPAAPATDPAAGPAAPASPAPAPEAPATPAAPAAPEEKNWQAEAEKWKKLSRENETKAKANAEAARRLAEREESEKTELEKANDRLAAAEERAAKATRQAVASRVQALATGKFADPADAVDALGQDFVDDAGQVDDAAIGTALAALLERKPHWAATATSRTPRPDPTQGPRPGGTANVEDLTREAQAKGDWKTAMRLQTSKLADVPRPK